MKNKTKEYTKQSKKLKTIFIWIVAIISSIGLGIGIGYGIFSQTNKTQIPSHVINANEITKFDFLISNSDGESELVSYDLKTPITFTNNTTQTFTISEIELSVPNLPINSIISEIEIEFSVVEINNDRFRVRLDFINTTPIQLGSSVLKLRNFIISINYDSNTSNPNFACSSYVS